MDAPAQTTTGTHSPASSRLCAATQLALVPHPRLGTWRVYKNAYGPLKARPRTGTDPTQWSRFDLPDQATIYSSTELKGAYAEVLAALRPRLTDLAALAAQEFDDVGPEDDPIWDEWCERGHMQPGSIPRIWHTERAVAQLDVKTAGWYVDVEHPRSLQTIRSQLAHVLIDQHVGDMDVSVIRGDNRRLTCAVAEWVASLYLEDGSVPLGIRYNSRHGTNWECWATFPETKIQPVHTTPLVPPFDRDLNEIANLFGLRLH